MFKGFVSEKVTKTSAKYRTHRADKGVFKGFLAIDIARAISSTSGRMGKNEDSQKASIGGFAFRGFSPFKHLDECLNPSFHGAVEATGSIAFEG